MSAKEESVESVDDVVLTVGERSSDTSREKFEAFERMMERDRDGLHHAFERYDSSKDFGGDESYAKRALLAEIGAWHMRDGLEREFRELNKTLAEEYEELPFESLASTEGLDKITAACTGPNPYHYPPLLPDPSAIRLVVLLPSLERHADIVCELCNSALTKLVSDGYEALSYVWGDPTRRRPIIVSRKLFQATENLEAALRSLRHRTKPRVLWIDAICINQNNIQERNEQVQLMGHIYRCARRVIVWLGPESETSGTAFRLMRNRLDVPEFATTAPQKAEGFWRAFLPGLWSFCRLVRRPYFKRVWCIQELSLARAVDVQCGQHCASMNDFLWMEGMVCDSNLLAATTGLIKTKLGSDEISIRNDLTFVIKLTQLHRKLLLRGVLGVDTDLESSDSALDLLLTFQDWLCSNDKDRVFALYGLLPPGSPDRDLLRPNYSLSVAHVYIRFAVRHLQQYKDLRILVTATRPLPEFVSRSAERELPSWVPDWRDVPRHGRCFTHHTIGISSWDNILSSHIVKYDTMYDACLGLQPTPLEFCHDFRTLCLSGIAVDKIEEIGPVFLGADFPLEQAQHVLSAWKNIAASSAERSYPYTSQSRREAFWRTLQMDDQLILLFWLPKHGDKTASDSPNRDPNDFMKRCRIPLQDQDFPPAEQDEVQLLDSNAYKFGPTLGRRFFRTAKGLFGLGPASALVDDDVAVLFGSRAPFVLRPDGESHRVIGECYVHGIMDGEAIHRPRRREFADLSTKEFHLV